MPYLGSFEQFWYGYKPGTTMLYRWMDRPDWGAWVIEEVLGGTFVHPPQAWEVCGWSLEFNGLHLDRVEVTMEVPKFSGEKLFQDHTRFIPDTNNIEDEEATKLIEYGKAYWDLVQKQCKYHVGNSRTFPYNKVSPPSHRYTIEYGGSMRT